MTRHPMDVPTDEEADAEYREEWADFDWGVNSSRSVDLLFPCVRCGRVAAERGQAQCPQCCAVDINSEKCPGLEYGSHIWMLHSRTKTLNTVRCSVCGLIAPMA